MIKTSTLINTIFLSAILTFAIFPSAGYAQDGHYFISPAIFYSADLQEQTAKADSSNSILDLRAGFSIAPNIFVGALYSMDNKNVKTSGYSTASNNYDEVRKRTSYGPFVGYLSTNFYALFTYLMSSQWAVTSTTSTGTTNNTYTGGGYQFDLGLKFPLWGVQFGPMISYKLYTYSDISGSTNQTLSPAFKETKLDPTLAIWIFF